MTKFTNRVFQIIPDNENKIIRVGCLFYPFKGVLICEATEEEKEKYDCGRFMTYPIIGDGYKVCEDEDVCKDIDYYFVGKKGDTLLLSEMREVAAENATYRDMDYYDLLSFLEDEGITITNRVSLDSDILLPDTISIELYSLGDDCYNILNCSGNYTIQQCVARIKPEDGELYQVIDNLKDNKQVYRGLLAQELADDLYSLRWFFNRKQLKVKIISDPADTELAKRLEQDVNKRFEAICDEQPGYIHKKRQ